MGEERKESDTVMTRGPRLSAGLLSFWNDKAIGLVERYCEPYLSNIRICIRVPHREAIPVRCDARILCHTNIISEPEYHSEASLCGSKT